MFKNIFLIVINIFVLNCYGQLPNNSFNKNIATKSIIEQIINSQNVKVVLVNAVLNDDLQSCFDRSLARTSNLTQKERLFIRKNIIGQRLEKWNRSDISVIEIVESIEIDNIFNDKINGWNNFRTKYNSSIMRFSKPIFIRNYTICIVSYSISTDYKDGYGNTSIYKLVNGKWKYFGISCLWES